MVTLKITQLANDMTILIRKIDSSRPAIEVLTFFKDISGLSLNKCKTEILQIGAILNTNELLLNN